MTVKLKGCTRHDGFLPLGILSALQAEERRVVLVLGVAAHASSVPSRWMPCQFSGPTHAPGETRRLAALVPELAGVALPE